MSTSSLQTAWRWGDGHTEQGIAGEPRAGPTDLNFTPDAKMNSKWVTDSNVEQHLEKGANTQIEGTYSIKMHIRKEGCKSNNPNFSRRKPG